MKLIAALVGLGTTPLTPAIAMLLETRRDAPRMSQALGWWIVPLAPGDPGIVTHRGCSAGFSANLAYDLVSQIGVVVLANSANDDGGIAWHLLRPSFPLSKPVAARREISADPAVLDRYAGSYRSPNAVFTIERDADGLIMKNPMMPSTRFRLHAETEREFFVIEVDLQLTFPSEDELIVHWRGSATKAMRIGVASR